MTKKGHYKGFQEKEHGFMWHLCYAAVECLMLLIAGQGMKLSE